MNITAKDIAALRRETGAGIMDCKAALTAAAGDLAKAKEWLKKKGLDRAAKKKERETGAGLVQAYIHGQGQVGVLLKLACETDFVARTEEFKKLAYEICLQIASMAPKNPEELMDQDYIRDAAVKIKDMINEAIAKTGENIRVEEFARFKI